MKYIKPTLWAAAALICFWFGLSACQTLIYSWQGVSVRFETPVTKQQAEQANKTISEQFFTESLTFWNEKQVFAESWRASSSATGIFFVGDAYSVWNKEYLYGAAPFKMDIQGCAVSEQLAWQLFGGTDVLGQTITLNKKEYAVRGVFRGKTEIFLAPATEAEIFSAAEYVADPLSQNAQQAVYKLCQTLELPEVKTMIFGREIAQFCKILMFVPVLIFVGTAVWNNAKPYLKKISPTSCKILILTAMVVAALYLPQLLELVPDWLIPTKWSDFDFWGELIKMLSAQWNDFLSLCPFQKDVFAKQALIQAVVFAVGCAACLKGLKTSRHKYKVL